ncbi:MAG: acyl-CoA dehydrogenase family protein [Gammaproteobacteria bacterium]
MNAAIDERGEDAQSLARYRAAARAFLERHAPAYSGAARSGLSKDEDLALGRAWMKLKCEHGYSSISLPKKFGGGGGTQVQRIVFAEEESRWDVPIKYFGVSLGMPVPIMAAYASEAECIRLLPPAVRGEMIWCQLFSEPAAGSDLAALRTSARREGDRWILNGQKLWTSWAHYADWGVLVARHDPNLAKHKGLTYFYVDMRTPGISVRSVKLLAGDSHVNEVFFDNVEIPDSQRLGEVGDGFKISIHTLMIERYSVLDVWGSGPNLHTLLGLLRGHTLNGRPAIEDPRFRELAVDAIIEERALLEIQRRAFAAIQAGRPAGPEGSIGKLLIASKRQQLSRVAMDLLGPAALTVPEGMNTQLNATASWITGPLMRIAGGTDQILRNTIAEKVLGLPQDHRPDKSVAFNKVPG